MTDSDGTFSKEPSASEYNSCQFDVLHSEPFAKSADVALNLPSDASSEVDLDGLDIGIAKRGG